MAGSEGVRGGAGFLKNWALPAAAVLFCALVLPYFLNRMALSRLQKDMPFGFEGQLVSHWPGRLNLENVRFKDKAVFEGLCRQARVSYHPLNFLLTGQMDVELSGGEIELQLGEAVFARKISDLRFDSLQTHLRLDSRGRIGIESFTAKSPEAVVVIKGSLSRNRLDVRLSCQLTPAILDKLPRFISEHLFAEEDSPYREIRFDAGGTWEQPLFSLSSDLVRLEVKTKEPGA